MGPVNTLSSYFLQKHNRRKTGVSVYSATKKNTLDLIKSVNNLPCSVMS